MGRQTRRTKIINLLNEILVTSECKSCNACLRLDFPNRRFFPLSSDHWQEELTEESMNGHHKYRGSLSGKRMHLIHPFELSIPETPKNKGKARKKRKRWSPHFDLLLRGCLNLFDTDLKKISLIIPEFNPSFIVKKIKQIKWLQLTINNDKYRDLTGNSGERKKDERGYGREEQGLSIKPSPQLLYVNATKEEESYRCTTPLNRVDKYDNSTYDKGEKSLLKENRNEFKLSKSPFVLDKPRGRRENLVFATPIQAVNKSFSMDDMGSKFINISPGGYRLDDLESESHFALFN